MHETQKQINQVIDVADTSQLWEQRIFKNQQDRKN